MSNISHETRLARLWAAQSGMRHQASIQYIRRLRTQGHFPDGLADTDTCLTVCAERLGRGPDPTPSTTAVAQPQALLLPADRWLDQYLDGAITRGVPSIEMSTTGQTIYTAITGRWGETDEIRGPQCDPIGIVAELEQRAELDDMRMIDKGSFVHLSNGRWWDVRVSRIMQSNGDWRATLVVGDMTASSVARLSDQAVGILAAWGSGQASGAVAVLGPRQAGPAAAGAISEHLYRLGHMATFGGIAAPSSPRTKELFIDAAAGQSIVMELTGENPHDVIGQLLQAKVPRYALIEGLGCLVHAYQEMLPPQEQDGWTWPELELLNGKIAKLDPACVRGLIAGTVQLPWEPLFAI